MSRDVTLVVLQKEQEIPKSSQHIMQMKTTHSMIVMSQHGLSWSPNVNNITTWNVTFSETYKKNNNNQEVKEKKNCTVHSALPLSMQLKRSSVMFWELSDSWMTSPSSSLTPIRHFLLMCSSLRPQTCSRLFFSYSRHRALITNQHLRSHPILSSYCSTVLASWTLTHSLARSLIHSLLPSPFLICSFSLSFSVYRFSSTGVRHL